MPTDRKRPPDRATLERELSYWRDELSLREHSADDSRRKVAVLEAQLRRGEKHASN